jgi:hypothetical protein
MNKTSLLSIIAALCASLLLTVGCTKETITVTAPTAGQKILGGDTIQVKWSQALSSPTISYAYGSGAWQEFATVLPVSEEAAKVVLPTANVSDSFRIQVEDKNGDLEAGASENLSLKFIILSSPTAGQTFTVGQSVTIAWRATAARLTSLQLMLSVNNGIQFQNMLLNSLPATQTSYTWVVGSEPGTTFTFPSSQCIIKLRDYGNDKYNDITGVISVQ